MIFIRVLNWTPCWDKMYVTGYIIFKNIYYSSICCLDIFEETQMYICICTESQYDICVMLLIMSMSDFKGTARFQSQISPFWYMLTMFLIDVSITFCENVFLYWVTVGNYVRSIMLSEYHEGLLLTITKSNEISMLFTSSHMLIIFISFWHFVLSDDMECR